MFGYLSADIICSEKRTVFREHSCELHGIDNVQGQISEHIFAPNGGYPSNLFAKQTVLKIGEYSLIFPSFSWGIFGHVTSLDQSHRSENIWWILMENILCIRIYLPPIILQSYTFCIFCNSFTCNGMAKYY